MDSCLELSGKQCVDKKDFPIFRALSFLLFTPHSFFHASSCTASESPRSRISVHHCAIFGVPQRGILESGLKIDLRFPVEFAPNL